MKLAIIEATFPELRGGAAHQSARGKGSTPRVAIARAFGNLLKGVKGKRFSTVQARVTLSEIQPADNYLAQAGLSEIQRASIGKGWPKELLNG